MLRATTAAALVLLSGASLATASEPSVSANGVTLRSVTITYPTSSRDFPGPGADAINANCVTCHSAGMVFVQPPLSKQAWTDEVTKMRKVYGAPVAEADVPEIVDYLAALKPGQ
ncbi:cytochrome c [Beijerinckia sp. L45]|jgi:cytochrome c5|uniref:c-type cytochrome n=1 Tax=Beijerinckia sp. L45 TaxID=1641855 RepID=UPI00131B5954|nr:cytochrome c [Beijerinckia sp. L45]